MQNNKYARLMSGARMKNRYFKISESKSNSNANVDRIERHVNAGSLVMDNGNILSDHVMAHVTLVIVRQ